MPAHFMLFHGFGQKFALKSPIYYINLITCAFLFRIKCATGCASTFIRFFFVRFFGILLDWFLYFPHFSLHNKVDVDVLANHKCYKMSFHSFFGSFSRFFFTRNRILSTTIANGLLFFHAEKWIFNGVTNWFHWIFSVFLLEVSKIK